MTINTTPRLGVLLMSTAMAQKETVFNEAVLAFDAMFSGTVLSMALTTPPTTPNDGDCYIVPTGATGAWNGQTNKIAFSYNGWQFLNIPDHYRVYNIADSQFHVYSVSSGWSAVATGTPTVLTDLSNVSVSSVTDGQYLVYDQASGKWKNHTLSMIQTLAALTDVTTTGVTAGQVLQWNGTHWVPYSLPAGVSTLAGLSDVDNTTLHSGYIATWSGTKLTFVAASSILNAAIPTVEQLADFTMPSGGLQPNAALVWNGATWTASVAAIKFQFVNMTDGPGTMVGAANKMLVVNSTETAVTYADPSVYLSGLVALGSLTDVSVTEGAGINGYTLVWNNSANKWQAKQFAVSQLSDASVTSPTNGQILVYNATTGKWTNGNLPTGAVSITGLSDVQVTEGSAINGYVLYWNNTDSKWEAKALATVATSGAYSDLSGKPPLAAVATTGAYSDLSGKPTLATVATTGAYSDLSGKPTLATVATSGAFADLTGKPTNATYTLSGLADVSLSGPADGQSLQYNSSTGKWIAGSGAKVVPSLTYKYVKLHLTGNNGGSAFSIADVNVIDPASVSYTPSAATATETASGSSISNLLDGTPSTYWISNDATAQDVVLTFAQAIIPSSLKIVARSDASASTNTPTAITIYGSNDNANFVSLGTVTFSGWTNGATQTALIVYGLTNYPASLFTLTDVDESTLPNSNQALLWNNTTKKWTPGTVSFVTDLAHLTDVDESTGPTDGQALVWSNSASKWKPGSVSAVLASLSGLTDVNVTEGSGIDGYVLAWKNADSKWEAKALAAVAMTGAYSDLSGKPTIPVNSSFSLAGLSDVNVTESSGIDGYTLSWSNSASKWVAVAKVVPPNTVAALTGDVAITTPAVGQVLSFNGTKWANSNHADLPVFDNGTVSGAITIDRSKGDTQIITLNGNVTGITISNWAASGQLSKLTLIIKNTGSFTVTFPTARWAGKASAPTVTTGTNVEDWFTFITVDGGATLRANIVGQNF